MHSNAMSSGASGQAESYDRAEANPRAPLRRPAAGRAERTARRIPEATVARLPVYLRALHGLVDAAPHRPREELAAAAGVNSAKLRKDLSYLGSYGIRGVGYDVDYLVYQISRTLGLTQDWPVAIIGIGNLGRALANYGGFVSAASRSPPCSTPTRYPATGSAPDLRHIDDSTTWSPTQGLDRGDRRAGRAAQAVADRLVRPG